MKQTRSFQHAATSVVAARRFIDEVLGKAPADAQDAAILMVSELASNCIRHTDSGFDLTITQRGDEIRVEATDCGSGEPKLRTPAPTDPSGRGLQIIDMFSDAWGYTNQPGEGKTVWFTLTLGGPNAVRSGLASG